MHRVGAGFARHFEQARLVQIALPGGRRADGHGPVGGAHIGQAGIGLGIHRHRFDTHAAQRADNTRGHCAPVGDEHAAGQARLSHTAPSRATATTASTITGACAPRGPTARTTNC